MPIYQRKSGVWYIDIRAPSGSRIRQSTGTQNKQEAQRLHDKLKHDLWQQEKLDQKPPRLWEEAALRWLHEKQEKKSIQSDICRLRGLSMFKGIYLHNLTRDLVMHSIAKTMQGKANATKNRYLALVRAILNKAANEWLWIDKAPKITLYREPKRRIRWLTPAEAERLIAALPEYMADMATFSLATGLRQSNVINLRWQQLDLQRGVAWVDASESKSGRAIGIALNQTALNVIQKQMGKHKEYVFTHSKGRRLHSISSRIWRNALAAAGISDFRWHDLRHTWASWLVQKGIPLDVLQEMGGWESIEMVQRYAHLAPEHLHRHAALLDDLAFTQDTKDTNWTHENNPSAKEKSLNDCLDFEKSGGSGGVRTHDQGIMSPLL